MELFDLNTFAGGALREKFSIAMQQVLNNLQDPNTSYKAKRHITVKVAFDENEDRDDASVNVSVSAKLAPASPVVTRMSFGKDLRSGEIFAKEYGKQVKGQMSLNLEEMQETEEESTKETNNKVIDLRKAAL